MLFMGWSLDGVQQSAYALRKAPLTLTIYPTSDTLAQAMLFTGWSLEGMQQSAYALGTGTRALNF